MSEKILSPDRLRALLAMFKEHHGKEYGLRAGLRWLLRAQGCHARKRCGHRIRYGRS